MSNNINLTLMKTFIADKIGVRLDKNEALKLGVEDEFADVDTDKNELEISDILEDDDLLAQFATMYKVEEDKKQEAKDKETEKEEETKVQDKNEAGV